MKKILLKTYSDMNGTVLAILGIFFSAIPWFLEKDYQMSVKLFFMLVVISIIIIAFLIKAVLNALEENIFPIVLRGFESNKPYEDFSYSLLLSPYKSLTFNSIVSVYLLENEIERLIGTGKILNIQQDGKTLVGVKSHYNEIDESIKNNNTDAINKLLVKSYVGDI